jgi:hypothetical protein
VKLKQHLEGLAELGEMHTCLRASNAAILQAKFASCHFLFLWRCEPGPICGMGISSLPNWSLSPFGISAVAGQADAKECE